jgi:hypothetical protein
MEREGEREREREEESSNDSVTWMAKALLDNGAVNTPRQNTHKATMDDVC